MFLLPLLVLALGAVAVYRVTHRQVQPAMGADVVVASPVQGAPFWPATVEGKVGVGAFALSLARVALVNVLQAAFLGWVLLAAALTLSAIARFRKHDRSTSVLIVLVLSAVGALASLLFLAGEVFVGHD